MLNHEYLINSWPPITCLFNTLQEQYHKVCIWVVCFSFPFMCDTLSTGRKKNIYTYKTKVRIPQKNSLGSSGVLTKQAPSGSFRLQRGLCGQQGRQGATQNSYHSPLALNSPLSRQPLPKMQLQKHLESVALSS